MAVKRFSPTHSGKGMLFACLLGSHLRNTPHPPDPQTATSRCHAYFLSCFWEVMNCSQVGQCRKLKGCGRDKALHTPRASRQSASLRAGRRAASRRLCTLHPKPGRYPGRNNNAKETGFGLRVDGPAGRLRTRLDAPCPAPSGQPSPLPAGCGWPGWPLLALPGLCPALPPPACCQASPALPCHAVRWLSAAPGGLALPLAAPRSPTSARSAAPARPSRARPNPNRPPSYPVPVQPARRAVRVAAERSAARRRDRESVCRLGCDRRPKDYPSAGRGRT